MKKLLLAFAFLNSWFSYAQLCNISYSGIILDEHDHTPVLSAKVTVKELNKTYSTDSGGYFMIDSLCPGVYNFLFYHHFGCEPVKAVKVLLAPVKDTVFLEYHYDDELEKVIIMGKSYSVDFLQKVKSASLDMQLERGKTWVDLLKTIPGVTSLSTGATIQKPVIHGMYGNRVLTLVDQARLEGQQWGNEHAPEVNPYAYESTTVIKGAAAVEYGSDAVGGVISTKMLPIPSDKRFGGLADLGYATNGNQLLGNLKLHGRFSKSKSFSWLLQGAYKKSGTLKAPSYYLANTAMDEVNSSAMLNYEGKRWNSHVAYTFFQTNLGILAAAHISNVSDLLKAFYAEEPAVKGDFTYRIQAPRLHTTHHLAVWNNTYKFNTKHAVELNYSFQSNDRKEMDSHNGFQTKESVLMSLQLNTQSMTAAYIHQWHPKVKGKIGVNYWHQTNYYEGRYFVPNYYKNAAGGFWIESWNITEKHRVEAGIRYDWMNYDTYLIENGSVSNYLHNYGHLSGTFQYLYTINHHLDLRVSGGNSWRAPSINELYSNGIHHGAALYEIGDRNLKEERAWNIGGGINYSSVRWSAQLDVYHYWFSNYIYLQSTGTPILTIYGAYPAFAYQQVQATYSGMDLNVNYKFTSWLSASLKGSLVRAYNQKTKRHLVNIPADRLRPSLLFTKEFKNEDQLKIRIGSTLVRKQTKAPVEYDYVAPPKGYVLMDLAVLYYLNYDKGDIVFSVNAENLLNTKYRDYMNRFRYYADEMGRCVYLKIQVPF